MARRVKALSTQLYPLFFQTIITSCVIGWKWTQRHLKLFCIYTFKTSLLELSSLCCSRGLTGNAIQHKVVQLFLQNGLLDTAFAFLQGTVPHTVFSNKESFNGRLVTLRDKLPVSNMHHTSCSLYNSYHIKNTVFSIKMIHYLT